MNVAVHSDDAGSSPSALTARQQAELAYHRDRAQEMARLAEQPVAVDVIESPRRRWWNAYWTFYTSLLALDLRGKRVLVVGCGFGEDAIRIAQAGAIVSACDLSPESVEIARHRARSVADRTAPIAFDVMPAERLRYPADSFDIVVLVDILHHVDIPDAMQEIVRVLAPGGVVVADELYTYSALQQIREYRIVDRWIAPLVQRFIYEGRPYVTEDERKLDQNDVERVLSALDPIRVSYFDWINGRVVPDLWPRFPLIAQIDRIAMRAAGRAGRYLANRVVFAGRVKK